MVAQQEGPGWQATPLDATIKFPAARGSRPRTPLESRTHTPRGSAGGGTMKNNVQETSALKSGAQALLSRAPQMTDAAVRARMRQERRQMLPPQMPDACGSSTGMHPPRPSTSAGSRPRTAPQAETQAAVDRICHSPVWGQDIDYRSRDAGMDLHHGHHEALGSCVDELVFGHDVDFSHTEDEARHHGMEEGDNRVGKSIANIDDRQLLSWQVQHVLARARSRGVKGLLRIAEAFQAASEEGALSFDAFAKAALAAGLCRSFFECGCAFRLFAGSKALLAPGDIHNCKTTLPVSVLLQKLELEHALSQERLAIVQEVWRRFDPDDVGEVVLRDLLAVLDVRRMPCVLNGVVEAAEAEREFLEALSAISTALPDLDRATQCFALNEAAAGRRPQPVGGRASPLETPAGNPTGQVRRFQRDYQVELASRKPDVDLSRIISFAEFKAYYTCVSTATPEDALFEQAVRNPWRGAEIHKEAMKARRHTHFKAKHSNPSAAPVMATFEDGSRRCLLLRDDNGLQEVAQGAAGVHCNQLWTWGPNVKKEVLRRLEVQGHHNIASVKLTPA